MDQEKVNHPSHYGGDTTYEAIKVIEAWELDFCLGNTVKYISSQPANSAIEIVSKEQADILSKWAQRGATMLQGSCGQMCGSCAFKKGSITQSEEHNVEAALTALAWEGQFNCHIKAGEDAGKPCVGFLYAKHYWDAKEHDALPNGTVREPQAK